MANIGNFNANEVEPTVAFQPVPAGKHIAAITASEVKATKKGDGSYLQLEFTVLEGPCQGRKVWDRLCINHPTPITQKIARGNLSAICRAIGVMQPGDSAELHNLPLVINVRCKKRQDNGELTNEIKGYATKDAAKNPPQQTTSTPLAPKAETTQCENSQSSVNNASAPWQR